MLSLLLASLVGASAAQPVVSVLRFESHSDDQELGYLSKGLADMLLTDLVAWDGVKVVERARLEDVLKELKLQQTKYVDKASAAKLGQVLNASHLIYGSVVSAGGKLRVEARLVRSSDGVILAAVTETDERDNIFALEQRLAAGVVSKIDEKLTANASARPKTKVKDADTVVAYGQALDLADQGRLDEAQEAMRALVSKAPTFMLARERQAELLKAFTAYQQRRKELVGDAVLEVGKLVDATLDANHDPRAFDALTAEQQQRVLSMRAIRARVLARVLKQHLTNRDSLRVIRSGHERQALDTMRAWVSNAQSAIEERSKAKPSGFGTALTPEEQRLLADSTLGSDTRPPEFVELHRFVFSGWLTDGESFTVAPVLSALDPNLAKAIDTELEQRVTRAIAETKTNPQSELLATQLLERKAEEALSRGEVDAAVGAWQRVLDAFPTRSGNANLEDRIKRLLEGRSNETRDFDAYAEALSTCDAMKIRIGLGVAHARMKQSGLKALDEIISEIEKKCSPPTVKTQSAFAQMFSTYAPIAARHDDCARATAYWKRYLDLDGSVSDMMGWSSHTPWCPIGELESTVSYVHATLDGGWSLEMPAQARSRMVMGASRLIISARKDTPITPKADLDTFELTLERQKDGTYRCSKARWHRYDGSNAEGTCTVSFKTLIPAGSAGADVGTFEAQLRDEGGRRLELSAGQFRVPRDN